MHKKITPLLFSLLIFSGSTFAVSTGEIAPSCLSNNFYNDQALDISSYKGKVIYLDFWASWCPPCKLSFPSLNKLHTELQSQGVEIIAINLDEEKIDAESFLKQTPVNFYISYDKEGNCPKAYNVMAMPSSYVIDKEGIVREIHLGFDKDNLKDIRNSILTLLSE